MNILVIPYLHCENIWKDIIKKHFNDVDKIIFLGDYVDKKNKSEALDNNICEISGISSIIRCFDSLN